MKLLKASFQNFRLLKDLTLDFSASDKKKLTVIRAANETGKTTCLYGLMWGLFGSNKAIDKNYIISPKDSVTDKTTTVDISVDIEFTQPYFSSTKGAVESEERHYRLKRSCFETWHKQVFKERSKDQISLYQIKTNGTTKLNEAEAREVLNNGLPASLQNVYFTDGDNALAFIEADAGQAAKRRRVSDAIESLLGIEILRQASKHMNTVASKFNSELDETDYNAHYTQLSDIIDGFEDDIQEAQNKLNEDEVKFADTKDELEKTNSEIEKLLTLGDKEKLVNELKGEKESLRRTIENKNQALKDLAELCCKNKSLSQSLIEDHAKEGLAILNDLRKQGNLPKVNIPILEELLKKKKCFCEEDLSPGSPKRKIIEDTISNSRESDAIQEAITSLYFSTSSDSFETVTDDWMEKYNELSTKFFNLSSTVKQIEDKIKILDDDINKIDDSNLQELREIARGLETTKTNLQDSVSTLAEKIKSLGERKQVAEEQRRKIEKELGKTSNVGTYINISRNAKDIFENIINKLKQEELKKVSDQLNEIFLKMIGSSPDDNNLTLITKTELTEDYDIVVYGPKGNKLDPDKDLNGASRRAITLSFILALTKVSEVEAPNVIDTPLGMMSGYVKKSVLENTIKQGSQIILFLTHDEINGIESSISNHAGKIYTLTSPAHYPKMLVNKPDVDDVRILRCECDHLKTCNLCERRNLED